MESSGESDDGSDTIPYKLVIVVRQDMRLSAGKLAVQVGHAVHEAIGACDKNRMQGWEADGSMIVVLQASGERDLRSLEAAARKEGLVTSIVQDEGLTEVGSGVRTVLWVGPDLSSRVNVVTGKLQLYRDPAEDDLKALRERLELAEASLAASRKHHPADVIGSASKLVKMSGPPSGASRIKLRDGDALMVLDLVAGDAERLEPKVPDLFESWTWEGDTTVLPGKWEDAITECFETSVADCTQKPWEDPKFDPDGIFFLTHRSGTCGIALTLDGDEKGTGVIACLGVQSAFHRRGVGRCLLRLCLQRHLQLLRTRVFCAIDAQQSPQGMQLLVSEGFKPF